ncbi:MAG: gamma-glutamylcyclotransferase [Alphaproteobacteria bacterium]|jgi:cation transport protein ChaC|nr:gamma-glutamylcyclotransferase [Alphaproteobacteria bacterium]
MKRRLVPDGLQREHFTEERIMAIAREFAQGGHLEILGRAERETSRRATLARLEKGQDVWIFGYGSLMWNPALELAETRPALLSGYHRSFCIWTPIGRGTPEQPGLMLALEAGGRCRGLAMRIAADLVEPETQIVWRREMISGSYLPRWVRVVTDRGPVAAITFVVDRRHARYAGRLSLARQIESIAFAEGRLGRCCDYLNNLVWHLDQLGVADGPMHRLLDQVEAHRRQAWRPAGE